MSNQTTPEPTVDSEITKLLERMSNLNPESEEYTKLVDQLTKLYKLKELDANLDLKNREQSLKAMEANRAYEIKTRETDATIRNKELDSDLKAKDVETYGKLKLETLAPIAGSLAGIVLILGFERAHVVTSKALGFVMKSR